MRNQNNFINENFQFDVIADTSPLSAFSSSLPIEADTYLLRNYGYGGTGGTWDYTWTFEVTTVPVPAAVWLFGSGLIGLVGLARRKANA